MKNALAYLLIVFSLALCGFISFQWVREARLRADIQRLTLESHAKSQELANIEGKVQMLQNEITRLDALKTELTETSKSNLQEIAQMGIELRKTTSENEMLARQLENYKAALESANNNIREQNDSLKRQNEELKLMVEQRNAAVLKQNELIEQYNELVKRFNELQEELKARSAAAAQ